MKRFYCILMMLCSLLLYADSARITQVDARSLFLNQRVSAYLSVTDATGGPVESFSPDRLVIRDSVGNRLEIDEVILGEARPDGVAFYLLVDNSGSMYYDLLADRLRIDAAKEALKSFVGKDFKPGDRLAVTEFNTLITPLKTFDEPLAADRSTLVDGIRRPERQMAYTELYAAMDHAVSALGRLTGRKALIVLSDGEDFAYFDRTGEPHPVWGSRTVISDSVLERARFEGITVYAVILGDERDTGLEQIAVQTGGSIFDPQNGDDLNRVYEEIHRSIEREVKVVFRPPVQDGGWETISIEYNDSTSSYGFYTPALLGARGALPLPVLLGLLVLAVLIYLVLLLIKYEKQVQDARIELFGGGTALQSTVILKNNATVIGSAGDMTITDNPRMKETQATILKDEKSGRFTVVSDDDVYVNNNPVRKKTLSAGDVLQVEGTTIIFDQPPTKTGGKKDR